MLCPRSGSSPENARKPSTAGFISGLPATISSVIPVSSRIRSGISTPLSINVSYVPVTVPFSTFTAPISRIRSFVALKPVVSRSSAIYVCCMIFHSVLYLRFYILHILALPVRDYTQVPSLASLHFSYLYISVNSQLYDTLLHPPYKYLSQPSHQKSSAPAHLP